MEILPITVLAPVYLWVAFRISKSTFSRLGITLFLAAGSVFAVLRVSCWLYLAHRTMSHTWNESLSRLSEFLIPLYPEAPIMSVIGGISTERYLFISGIALAVCSFVWATPLLLVGAGKRDGLTNASGA